MARDEPDALCVGIDPVYADLEGVLIDFQSREVNLDTDIGLGVSGAGFLVVDADCGVVGAGRGIVDVARDVLDGGRGAADAWVEARGGLGVTEISAQSSASNCGVLFEAERDVADAVRGVADVHAVRAGVSGGLGGTKISAQSSDANCGSFELLGGGCVS